MEQIPIEGQAISITALKIEVMAMRRFLEPVLKVRTKRSDSKATDEENIERASLYAAIFLVKTFGCGWTLTGGTPKIFNLKTSVYENRIEAGFASPAGWIPYWWAVHGTWIVDIGVHGLTEESVVITSKDDLRYRSSFDKNEIFYVLKNTKTHIQNWHMRWLDRNAQRVLAPVTLPVSSS